MTYPGNASLSAAIKQRVVSTFQQTLALYHYGRTDEVTAGCNLILQMDPTFEPAKRLIDKVRNPDLPIDPDTLLPADNRSLMQQAQDAMAERDFQRVIQLTTDILTDDLLNDDARILGDQARDKLEAKPFVDQFVRKCDESIAGGNYAAAKMDLEKARALDPDNPEVVRIAQVIASREKNPITAPIPSFIVDEPPPPAAAGRSTAQAADFGFAFEEDAPTEVPIANVGFDAPAAPEPQFGGFSFDAPATGGGPSQASGSEFDFATAAVVTSEDDQKKIEQYLADGDLAFDSGDYQQAIEAWSRIFLIDVTNDEASERIERAKAKRRAIEEQVDPILSSAIAAFEQGNTAQARTDLNEVLRIDPQNTVAQSYFDRISEGAEGGAAAISKPYIPPSVGEDSGTFDLFDEDAPRSDDILMPPSPAVVTPAVAKTTASREATPKTKRGSKQLPIPMIAAILAVVLLAGGGWFVWNRFMNKPAAEAAGGQTIIDRASALASTGKYDQAIALLQDIKPNDPQHDQAMVMIADLRARKSSAAQAIDGIPAAQYYEERLVAGREAFAAHDYAGAKLAYEQAQRVKPLPPDLKAQYEQSSQQVAKLGSAKGLFAERKYAEAIAVLQPLLEQDPTNQNIRQMIVDAHFNLGAIALQEEKGREAIREFDEVLKVNPADELAKRSRELALRYEDEPKDLLYRIYVKYLPLRQPT